MTGAYVDATVLVHSLGSDETLRSARLDVLELTGSGRLRGEAAGLRIEGLELFAAQPSLEVRDAIHAAVAERLGLEVILTTDAGFDDLPGLRRVDPRDEGRMRELTG